MDDIPESDPPIAVDLQRDRALTVTWADGAHSSYDLTALRRACPCAECRGLRERGSWVGPAEGEQAEAAGAELVGRWGLQITWTDGHATGIYAWAILRAWDGPPADGSSGAAATRDEEER